MPETGKVAWAPDYGLPIQKPTHCKTGTHTWVTIGEEPKPGDLCTCGLREWPDPYAGKSPES